MWHRANEIVFNESNIFNRSFAVDPDICSVVEQPSSNHVRDVPTSSYSDHVPSQNISDILTDHHSYAQPQPSSTANQPILFNQLNHQTVVSIQNNSVFMPRNVTPQQPVFKVIAPPTKQQQQLGNSSNKQSIPQQHHQHHYYADFPHHTAQLRRIYQLMKKEQMNFYILTGSSTNIDFKMFIPAAKKQKVQNLVSQGLYFDRNERRKENFQISWINFRTDPSGTASPTSCFAAAEVDSIQQYNSFVLSGEHIFLVYKSLLSQIPINASLQFRFTEAPNIRFPCSTNMENIGEELTEAALTDPRTGGQKHSGRAKLRNQIAKYLTGVYKTRMSGVQKILLGITKAAALMETDIFNQFKDVSRAEMALGSTLQAYVGRLDSTKNYQFLYPHPDIHYLALTKPHVRLNLSTVAPVAASQTRPRQTTVILPSSGTAVRPSSGTAVRPVMTTAVPFLRPVASVQPNFLKSSPLPIISNVTSMATHDDTQDNESGTQAPVIVSVASVAPASNVAITTASLKGSYQQNMSRNHKFHQCPFPPEKCQGQNSKVCYDRLSLINHLTLQHFQESLLTNLIQMQSKQAMSSLECPYPNCGYASNNSQDLLLHYGNIHNSTVQKLQSQGFNLKSLHESGFQFLLPIDKSFSQCNLCQRTICKVNLTIHQSVIHLMEGYMKEMQTYNSWTSARASGKCPLCPYQYGIGEAPTPAVAKTRDILLVKHFATIHVTPQAIQAKYGITSVSQRVSSPIPILPKRVSSPKVEVYKDILKPKFYSLTCKTCKRNVAEENKGLIVRKSHSVTSKCYADGKIMCWICSKSVDITKHASSGIKEHFAEDEHIQKEVMMNLLLNVYCKARGFSLDAGFIPANYKFFILALKAFAVHNETLSVQNCLSLLMNILEISMKQYNDLYNHVDKLASQPIPNYLCYCCNYAEYGRVSGLVKHSQSPEHVTSVQRLLRGQDSNEYLFCSGCGALFNTENIMVHAEHLMEPIANNKERDEEEEAIPSAKKRRLLSEEEADKLLDNGSDTDSVADPNYEAKESEDEEEEFIVESDGNLSDHEASDNDPDVEKETLVSEHDVKVAGAVESEDVRYYYFCLDCETHEGNKQTCSHVNHPRCPISMDIASHMVKTNHQNFIPIQNKVGLRVQNISFNSDLHKTVLKKWKQLVKDGDITQVDYEQPRQCGKCGLTFSDAIEMFKHIKEDHVKKAND